MLRPVLHGQPLSLPSLGKQEKESAPAPESWEIGEPWRAQVQYRGPAPAEQCVSLDAAALEQLQRSSSLFFGKRPDVIRAESERTQAALVSLRVLVERLPTETIPAVAAFLGPVALAPLRRASSAHAQERDQPLMNGQSGGMKEKKHNMLKSLVPSQADSQRSNRRRSK